MSFGDQQIKLKKIGIVIPAFNESKTINKVISGALSYGGIPIVVDDGSSDDTAKVAIESGAEVLVHNINMGYDQAINSGFLKAKELNCDCIITLDADGQHNPQLIEQFVKKIESGADVVIGIRNKTQRFSEKIFSIFTNIKFSIKDPLCGLKAYKIEVYNELGYFDSYKSIGTELALYAANSGKSICQIEFITLNRIDKPRFGKVIIANYKILRSLFFALINKKYNNKVYGR